jgi:streptomycin 6-kinase
MTGVPFELSVTESFASKAAWDATTLELVATMLERWNLTAGTAFEGGVAASVLAVTTADGEPAVLKVGYPHWEAEFEAVGLDAYGAELAPRVLRQDAWTWSLLIERVEPGIPLPQTTLAPDAALTAAARLHRRLSTVVVPEGVPTVAEVVESYLRPARSLATDPLVSEALDQLERLSTEPAPTMLLHGDFNPGNILTSGGGFRVIDPKPLVGDPAFDLWPLLEQVGAPSAESLSLVARLTGYPRDRIVRWCFARAGLNVTWLLDDADEPPDAALAEIALERVRFWKELSGL